LSFTKASVRDAPVTGRSVLLRADLNVPLDEGEVADDTRIRASLPTIELLRERDARTVVTSHLGRPKGRDPALSLSPVAARLGTLLDTDVNLAPRLVGDETRRVVERVEPGSIAMLENSRFEPGETNNDPKLAGELASMFEVYVNDAFGASHRAHVTTEGVAHLLPAYAGLLLEREVRELAAVRDDPSPPLVLTLGGAKVSDKIGVLERFLDSADEILIGGAMCFAFFAAQGRGTGDSLVEDEGVELAQRLLDRAPESHAALRLPDDLVLGERFDESAQRREHPGVDVPEGWMGLDIGPRTAGSFAQSIGGGGTVFWNGPMGAFELEPFSAGTRVVAEAVAAAPGHTVVGGGDSVAALMKFGLADSVDWVSTGGGASLELLEGRPLPGVSALTEASEVSA
jgi:phosphoglycerate kinase